MHRARLAWAIGAGLVIAWTLAGLHFDHTNEPWLPKFALVAAAAAPLFFVLMWTGLGLAGGAQWWKNDVGVNLVWLEIAAICDNGLLAWAVVFNHGILNTPYLAWTFVGGLLAGAIIITWRSVIFFRADLFRRRGENQE